MASLGQWLGSYGNKLAVITALWATVACAGDVTQQGSTQMDLFAENSQFVSKRLELDALRPSAFLDKPVSITETMLKGLFPEMTVAALETTGDVQARRTGISLHKDGEFFLKLTVSQLRDRKSVVATMQSPFKLISGPLDGLHIGDNVSFDRVGLLNPNDTLSVGSRGNIVITAQLAAGETGSSTYSGRLMDALFGDARK